MITEMRNKFNQTPYLRAYSFPNVLTGRIPPGQFNSNSLFSSALRSAYGDYTPMMPYHAITTLDCIAPGYANKFQITR